MEETNLQERLLWELGEAEKKAWTALAGYKFWMFGYWAGVWVHLNRLGGLRRPNPFRRLVKAAREVKPHTMDAEGARPPVASVRAPGVQEPPRAGPPGPG